MLEEWKKIPGHVRFEVSNIGRVRRRLRSGNRLKGTMLKTWDHCGYLRCKLIDEHFLVHRLVCMAFNGLPYGNKILALHVDGNKRNNAPGNLYWGDHSDNQKDSRRHGTVLLGTDHPNTVLNEDLVIAIRAKVSSGHSQRRIARDFGVSRGTVENVITGRAWSWVD